MITKNTRLFFASFFSTLLIFAFLGLFLLTDYQNSRFGNDTVLPAFAVERSSELDYSTTIMGNRYPLSLESLNELDHLRKEYAVLTTPRAILWMEQADAMLNYYSELLYYRFLDWEWQQNTQSGEPESPLI